MNKYKVGIFKNKSDMIIHITDDNIINITGMMGSGKSTLANKIRNENNIELISLDWLFGYGRHNMPNKINNIIMELERIYPETKNQCIFHYFHNRRQDKNVELKYYEYSEKIYQYLIKNIKNSIIIEGRHIYKYIDLKYMKGNIIIKRTSLLNSYKRAFKRDVFKCWRNYKSGKVGIKILLDKFLERVKIPIIDYIELNKYITYVVENNKYKICNTITSLK